MNGDEKSPAFDGEYWAQVEADARRVQESIRNSASAVRAAAMKAGFVIRLADNRVMVSAAWYDLPASFRSNIVNTCVAAVDGEEILVVDDATGAVVGIATGFQFREFPKPHVTGVNHG